MEVTGGTNTQDVVPIQVRQPILQTWVSAKQMAQQQITRNLGIEEEVKLVSKSGDQGSVVQSIVSLTTSLRRQLLKYMWTTLSNVLLFFVEKM